jgi:hypothetical protein
MTLQLQQHWHKQRNSRVSPTAVDACSSSSSSSSDNHRLLCHRSLSYPLPVYIDAIGAADYNSIGTCTDIIVHITLPSSASATALNRPYFGSNQPHAAPPTLASWSVMDTASDDGFTCTVSAAVETVLGLMKVRW